MTKYAKLISETQIQFPPKNKDGICNYDLDVELLIEDGYKEYIEAIIPTTNRHFHIEYVETDVITQTIVYDETQEEADARDAKARRDALDALTLTPADVERELYKKLQMDFEDLKALIVQQIPTIDIKALSIEFRAKDFYRGAQAGGMRLFDAVGALLGYTPDDMDYLFEHKELPIKED